MWLTVERGPQPGRRVSLGRDQLVIGRDYDCGFRIDDGSVSRHHAAITEVEGAGAVVRDLASTNGVIVDGIRIAEPTLLHGGEQIEIGTVMLRFWTRDPAATVQLGPTGVTETVAPVRTPNVIPAPPAAPARAGRRTGQLIAVAAGAAVVAAGLAVGAVLVLTGGSDHKLSTAQIVDRARPSTVEVLSKVDGKDFAGGTGWVLDSAQGLIVTNNHVIAVGETYAVVGASGGERKATLVATSPCEDLAILKVKDTAGLQTLALGEQATVHEGDEVTVLGYPESGSADAKLTATRGVVSVARTSFDSDRRFFPALPNVVQTDAAINPGNSGGPLLDDHGRLIGVNTLVLDVGPDGRPIQNQGYAIGVDRVKSVTDQLRGGRSKGFAGFWIETQVLSDTESVAGVIGVLPGSKAADAIDRSLVGVATLVAVGDHRIASEADYCSAVAKANPGDKATFTFEDGDGNRFDAALGFL